MRNSLGLATLHLIYTLVYLVSLAPSSYAGVSVGTISVVGSSILGQDPQTVNRLNGGSFQQDPLVTFNGTHHSSLSSQKG